MHLPLVITFTRDSLLRLPAQPGGAYFKVAGENESSISGGEQLDIFICRPYKNDQLKN